MKGLRAELARVGIRGALADRIVAELDDHLACDPQAQLGEPRLIAQRFADELRLPRTRRATYLGFGGLVASAILLFVFFRNATQPTGLAGRVSPFAGLDMVLGAQVAFVGGMLALWGARRGTAAAVVQRRLLVALGGGALVLAGAAVDAVAEQRWLTLLMLLPAPVLAASAAELRVAVGLTPVRAAVSRGFSLAEAASVGAAVVGLVVVGSAVAEHSWLEGVTRGTIEAVVFALGLFGLGRYLGIIRE
jgi:hypothetical protein